MAHQEIFPSDFYQPSASFLDTPAAHLPYTIMFSKIFALSTLLGLLAALPANAAEIEVVAGGPDGLIQYNPSFVVGCP